MLYFGKMLYPIIDRTLFCSATHSFNISCKCNIWKNAVSYYWPYLHFAQCILFVYCNILVKSCILLLAVLYFVAHLDKNQCRPPTASAFCQMVFFFCLLLYLITVEMWYLVKKMLYPTFGSALFLNFLNALQDSMSLLIRHPELIISPFMQ